MFTDADDVSTDDALQRALAMAGGGGGGGTDGNGGNGPGLPSDFSAANFGDLGKLDDSMLRLLTESAMDQQIADPLTEEHLKS